MARKGGKRRQGNAAGGCYAAALGDCKGPLNREHFASKHLLKKLEEGGPMNVIGYPHGNDAGRILMSAESLSAKVLCESHNRRLSPVDKEGGRFILSFFEAQHRLLGEEFAVDQRYEFDGPLIERWLLKFACGLIASGQAGVGPHRITQTTLPLELVQVVFGLGTLPGEWGMYTRATNPVGVAEKISVGLWLYWPLQPDGSRPFGGVKMEHHGFTTVLTLGTPPLPWTGTDLEGAIRHPGYFQFEHKPTGRSVHIVVKWPPRTNSQGMEAGPEPVTGFHVNLHNRL